MNRIFVLSILVLVLAACGTLSGETLTIRTADPNMSLSFRLLPGAPIAPTPDNPVVPPTTTAEPSLVPTPTATPCRTIAGNINSQGQKLWHDESSPQWSQIRIDESKGERWFCDAASAEAAGWTKAGGQ